MYKILIADDVAEICNGLSNYFPWRDYGFEVAGQATDGVQVLEFIAANQVDVLLCDIKMPLMDGIELAKELFDRKSPVKIVFISAFKEFEYAKKALAYGVVDYLVKPTKYDDLAELCSKIKTELDKTAKTGADMSLTDFEINGCNYNDRVITTVKNYIEEHFREATLEKAAELIHMNSHYLSRFFKDKNGRNFSDYLMMVRMKKAVELLQNFEYRTYQISDLVGYSNPKNFTRTFKNYFGKTPREFRNSPQSGNK